MMNDVVGSGNWIIGWSGGLKLKSNDCSLKFEGVCCYVKLFVISEYTFLLKTAVQMLHTHMV